MCAQPGGAERHPLRIALEGGERGDRVGLRLGDRPVLLGVVEGAEPGGPISFEIDTTGLTVWTLWDHARFLEGAERSDYLGQVCPAIELGGRASRSSSDQRSA